MRATTRTQHTTHNGKPLGKHRSGGGYGIYYTDRYMKNKAGVMKQYKIDPNEVEESEDEPEEESEEEG